MLDSDWLHLQQVPRATNLYRCPGTDRTHISRRACVIEKGQCRRISVPSYIEAIVVSIATLY